MNELIAIAEENDGLLMSKQARRAGILDSVLVRLAQRGRLERAARGVYRIAHYPQARFSQYREAILWAEASQGPEEAVLSMRPRSRVWHLRRKPIAGSHHGSEIR